MKEEQKKNDKNENEEMKKGEDNNLMDLKKLYYSHPSQKNKKKKDFTEYERIDMKLLNKKRERENKEENEEKIENKNDDNTKNEQKIVENVKKIEKNEKDFEKNLPEELIKLIEQTKNIQPWKMSDFKKYITYKKLNIKI